MEKRWFSQMAFDVFRSVKSGMLVAAIVLSLPQVEAASILIVSDAGAPGAGTSSQQDDTLISTLTAEGHTLNTFGMGGTMQGDWSSNPAAVSAVAAADLVLVSRRTSSTSYNEPSLWNSVTTPILLMNGYLARDNRWGWSTNDDINSVPLGETDMTLTGGGTVQLFDWSGQPGNQAPKGIDVPLENSLVSGAVVNGTMASGAIGAQRAIWFEIPAGTLVDGVPLGGDRTFFGTWGYDLPTTSFDDNNEAGFVANLGGSIDALASSMSAVPEPSTTLPLAAIIGGTFLLSRKRHTKS